MKVLRYILLSVLLVVVLVAIGGFVIFNRLTRGPLPQHTGTIQLSGLDGPVEILRDEYGVPHIYATTVHDLFMAQGFTQAQDRWWQMEFSRAIGDGRIQEITGANDDLMGSDVFIRTIGWRRAAERNIRDAYNDETLALMQAFADGVNAYVAGKNGGDLALDYSLLEVTGVTIPIDTWTPADSEVWLRVMAWDLSNELVDRARTQIIDELGEDALAIIEPEYPFDRHPTIIQPDDLLLDDASLTARHNPPVSAVTKQGTDVELAGSVAPDINFAFGRGDGIGSNNWVVDGAHTVTGQPMLANDPHLSIQMPSIWYEVGLHCQPVGEACPYDVRGYALPALPGVVLGHNARIAWGMTNINPDVIDLFAIKVNPDNPLQYEFDGEMRDMLVHDEEIRFGDGGSITIQVRETHLGPIINDNALDENGQPTGFTDEPLAFRWTALDTSDTLAAIFKLNAAQNWDDFREAATFFDAPLQNLVYADVDGNIGYQTPGHIPIRPAVNNGLVIQDGSTSATSWLGYIPSDLLPRALNPDRGWIHSANEALVPLEYYDQLAAQLTGDFGEDINVVITTQWDYGFRGARITEMLTATDQHDIASLQAIQADNKILVAEAMTPVLAGLTFDDPALSEARDWMLDWDYQANRDSGPAALFSALWKRLPDRVFNDQYGEVAEVSGGSRIQWAIILLLDDPDNELWDDVSTETIETRDDLLRAAFTSAHGELVALLGADRSQWEWGKLHTAQFVRNPLGLSGISLIEDIVNREAPVGGWVGAVNATNWSTQNEDFSLTSLPSFRSVYDLSDWDNSRGMHTTGQSGHPYSANYDDQIPLWASVTYKPMPFTRTAVEATTIETLRLEPVQ